MISYRNLAMRVLNHAPCVRGGGKPLTRRLAGAGRGGGTDGGNGCSGLADVYDIQKR